MIKCPVCKRPTGEYLAAGKTPGTTIKKDYLLYQFSYKGQPGYISPRCLGCYEKTERRAARAALQK